jgi:hypothetical protein
MCGRAASAAQIMGGPAWKLKTNCREFAPEKFTGPVWRQRFATRRFPIYALNVINCVLNDIIGREQ